MLVGLERSGSTSGPVNVEPLWREAADRRNVIRDCGNHHESMVLIVGTELAFRYSQVHT